MRSSINLASPIVAERHPVEKLLVVSVFVFIGVFLIAGSMLGYLVYVRSEVSQAVAQETSLKKQINQAPQQKVDALILKDRLNDITKILSSRRDINTKISAVTELLPESLTISTFSINEDTISIELVTSDLAVFDSLLENDILKLQNTPGEAVSKMTIDSFHVQPQDPRYTMTATFSLK